MLRCLNRADGHVKSERSACDGEPRSPALEALLVAADVHEFRQLLMVC
jgi:hypothetical protein